MVRFKGADNLDDVSGKLGGAFRAVTLASLQARFFSAAAAPDKTAATQALDHFYESAGKLRSRESEFNNRARPSTGTPSLMTNLRNTEHFSALREFNAAKDGLLGINAQIGQSIISLVEKDIAASARIPARTAFAKTKL